MSGFERHLAAVWFADIVGYTQLSSRDEDLAFALVGVLQRRARTLIAEHDGRLVKCIGDAVLAEFRSTEAAVQAALALRDDFAVESRNMGYPAQLRIGVHAGEVRATADGDVYGDGVNTASRLQTVAQPGQVVVSQDVWRQLRPRPDYRLQSLGERRLKGIAGAVHAFSVDRLLGRDAQGDPQAQPPPPPAWPHPTSGPFPALTRRRALGVGLAVLAVLAAVAVSQRWLDLTPSTLLRPQAAHAAPAPAVAVLPFTSDGEDDGLWSEGVPDLMARSLEASRQLRVVDPRAVMHRLPDPRAGLTDDDLYALGEGLEARYTVTGRLEREDGHVTLEAEVHDVLRREHLGTVAVDGAADRIAYLVDRLATRALEVGLGTEIEERPSPAWLATASIPALRAYLRGEQLYRRSRWSDAREAFQEAVRADPEFALALYRLALTDAWTELPHRPRASVHNTMAERHVAGLPERDSLRISGLAQLSREDPAALETLSHLVRRYPDDVDGWFLLGDARYHLGRGEERTGVGEALQQALRLDPGYGPAYLHLIDEAVAAGDTGQVRHWLSAYRRADPGSPLLSGFDWALRLSRNGADDEPRPASSAPEEARSTSRPAPISPEPSSAPAEAGGSGRTISPPVETPPPPPAERISVDSVAPPPESARPRPAADSVPPGREPPARPAAEPAAPDRAAVSGVLSALERAIEAKDVRLMRQVWTDLTTDEVESFQRSLPGMRELDVSFELLEVSVEGAGAVARVRTTYAFETTRGEPERQSFVQVFRIGRSGGRWVIVDSSAP